MIDSISLKLKADELIRQALKEDISYEDITTKAIIRDKSQARVELLCKEDGLIAGLHVFERVFQILDNSAKIQANFIDGDRVKKGDIIAIVEADISALLSGERTALNFLQRMSGIASHTRRLSDILKDTNTKLFDTRKTTPNMRIFEKYSVKVGGGYNHRYNLSDGIMLKDNHIDAAGGVREAIEMAKEYAPLIKKIEVEVENLDMLRDALEAGADIIMLDNMDSAIMKEAVEIVGDKALTECSGNVTEDRLAEIGEIGVDFVSCGALTHSSSILDLSMKNLRRI